MEQSKQWLNQAKQLCAELGPEDGVDPRLLKRKSDPKAKNHKSQQLCKVAKQTLLCVLSGELSDPTLQSLDVDDVSTNDDGQFLIVSVSHRESVTTPSESEILNKLEAVQGYLRSTVAQSVKRKHVPALKFQLVRRLMR